MDQLQQFQRHDLVWLNDTAWQGIIAAATEDWQPALRDWQQSESPVVVHRRDNDAAVDEICIALSLPPQNGEKLTFSARVQVEHILEHQSGLALNTVIPVALPEWQPLLRELHAEASASGVRFRVFGSLSFQFLTGKMYLSPASDIDLLFKPQDAEHLVSGLALLQRFRSQLPLDGEVVFPRGQGVAWKEWLLTDSAPEPDNMHRVLVRDQQQVRLCSRRDLILSLSED